MFSDDKYKDQYPDELIIGDIKDALIRVKCAAGTPISIKICAIGLSNNTEFGFNTDKNPCPAFAATDGQKVYFNVDEVRSVYGAYGRQNISQIAFILAHEILHILHMHIPRSASKYPKIWNIATDLYINSLLVKHMSEAGNKSMMTMVDWCLLDDKMTFETHGSAEEIYLALMQNNNQNLKQILKSLLDKAEQKNKNNQDKSPQEKKEEQDRIDDLKNRLDKAKSQYELDQVAGDILGELYPQMAHVDPDQAKSEDEVITYVNNVIGQVRAGLYPGEETNSIDRTIGSMWQEPKVKWNAEFRRFRHSIEDQEEYSFRKLNRVGLSYNIISPSIIKDDGKPAVLVGIDTSGSITDQILEEIAAELIHTAKHCRLDRCDVDTEAYDIHKDLTSSDIRKMLTYQGGGGTNLNALFEKVKKEKLNYDGLVFFTDSYTTPIELMHKRLFTSVLWVVYGCNEDISGIRNRLTFGNIIKIQI